MTSVRRLSRSTLPAAAPAAIPAWLAEPGDVRIAHLGPGPFHRAHQALLTDAACAAAGERWGIATCSSRSDRTVRELGEQDGLFSVVVRDGDERRARVVGAVAEAGPRARFAELLADPAVTVATLTVTEQHYPRIAATLELAADDPAVAGDLAAGTTDSLPGLVHAGLLHRWRRDAGPIAVISCDNLRANGALTGALVRGFAERAGAPAPYLDWLHRSVAFPDTVVDRLVPVPTDADRDDAARLVGLRDELAVGTEDYAAWIIEHAPGVALPPWDRAGARFVDDTAADERVKLHVLNGAHSLLASLGLLAGLATVGEAMANAPLARAVERFHDREVLPRIGPGGGLDPTAFAAAVRARFANPAIHHGLAQIAGLGSLKLAERIVPLAADTDTTGAGGDLDMAALAIAAWLRLVEADDRVGTSIPEPRAAAVRHALVVDTAAAVDAAGLAGRGELVPFVALVDDALAELRRGEVLEVVEAMTNG